MNNIGSVSMKNVFKWLGIIALAAVIGFSMTACGDLLGKKDKDKDGEGSIDGGGSGGTSIDGGGSGGSYESGFTSLETFENWLSKQPTNTPNTAYTVKLKVNSFSYDFGLKYIDTILKDNPTKYVSLDLSGSTVKVFSLSGCTSLTGITIPNKRKMTHFTQLQG